MNKIDSLTGVPQLPRLCSFSLDLYDIKEESIWTKALWGKGGGDSKCSKLKTHFLPRLCLCCFTSYTIILSIKHYLQYTACFFNHIFRGGQPSARGGLVPPDPPGISAHALEIHLLPCCLFIFVNQLMQMLTDTTLNFNNVLNFEMNINITNY